MKCWNEVRTMLQVAKLGNITAASQALGIHRATVLRHLELIESELGAKLFVRGQAGYSLTEAGVELARIAEVTQEQFNIFSARTSSKGNSLEGDFIITSLEPFALVMMPVIKQFLSEHPKIKLRYLATDSTENLEYGQVHIAIRSGPKPVQPDCVVLPFLTTKIGLCAHKDYVKAKGVPRSIADFKNHDFILTDHPNPKFEAMKWMQKNIPKSQQSIVSSNWNVRSFALRSGAGISTYDKVQVQTDEDLVPILSDEISWEVQSWVVTHGDLHRSEKVQAFLSTLRSKQFKNILFNQDA